VPLVVIAGKERLTSQGISGKLTPRQDITVEVDRPDGTKTSFVTTARLDTPIEISYYRNSGIPQTVLRRMLKG